MAKSEPSLFEDPDAVAEAAADARAEADLQAGRVVSHKAMKAWLQSWGTQDELPPPAIGS